MFVNHRVTMDLTKQDETPIVDVVREDANSRRIDFILRSGFSPWYPPEDATVLIRYQKEDHTGGEYDTLPDGTPAYQISGCTVSILLAPQTLTAEGNVDLSVTLIHGNSQLSIFRIKLNVTGTASPVEASEDYQNVTSFIPQPESSAVGQYLEISEVDKNGKILSVRAVDAPEMPDTPELPENVVTCDLEGSTEDASTVPVNADTLGGVLPDKFLRTNPMCITDFKSLVTFNSALAVPHANTRFIKMGDYVSIFYVGPTATTAAGTSLFTLPEGYLPCNAEECAVFAINAGGYGVVRLDGSTGICSVLQVSSTTTSGRIRFRMDFFCSTVEVTEVTI